MAGFSPDGVRAKSRSERAGSSIFSTGLVLDPCRRPGQRKIAAILTSVDDTIEKTEVVMKDLKTTAR